MRTQSINLLTVSATIHLLNNPVSNTELYRKADELALIMESKTHPMYADAKFRMDILTENDEVAMYVEEKYPQLYRS